MIIFRMGAYLFTSQIFVGISCGLATPQLIPTHVHRNFANTAAVKKNNVILLGIAGRQKLTKRLVINVEYYYALPNQLANNIKNSLSVCFDIETGGHIFNYSSPT